MSYTIHPLRNLSSPALDGKGSVYGLANVKDGQGQPCVWTPEGLQVIDGAPRGSLLHVSRNGDLLVSTAEQAVLYSDGEAIQLPPFLNQGLNDHRQVFGLRPDFQGLLWDNGKLVELPGGFEGAAINNSGVIAGLVGRAEDFRAGLFHDGELHLIEVDGIPIKGADDINDAGQVFVGGYRHDHFHTESFVGVWKDGDYKPIELPYPGTCGGGLLNERGMPSATTMSTSARRTSTRSRSSFGRTGNPRTYTH